MDPVKPYAAGTTDQQTPGRMDTATIWHNWSEATGLKQIQRHTTAKQTHQILWRKTCRLQALQLPFWWIINFYFGSRCNETCFL